ERDATERVEAEPAELDPMIYPVHHETRHSPVPTVVHHAHAPAPTSPPAPAPAPTPAPAAATVDGAERVQVRARVVKLAKISRTGDRVFRSLATSSGLLIVLLVLFVGFFLFAL